MAISRSQRVAAVQSANLRTAKARAALIRRKAFKEAELLAREVIVIASEAATSTSGKHLATYLHLSSGRVVHLTEKAARLARLSTEAETTEVAAQLEAEINWEELVAVANQINDSLDRMHETAQDIVVDLRAARQSLGEEITGNEHS